MPLVNVRLLAALIPNSRLEIIRGGGHMCLLVQAQALAPQIKEFLGLPRIPPDAAPVEMNAVTR